MNYLVEIIKAIAWPLTIIWIGYYFKAETRSILARLSSLKYGDVEASFEKELAKAELSAKIVNIPPPPSSKENINQKEQLLRIAEVSPRAAIVEAWALIEIAAVRKGLIAGTTVPRTNTKMIVEFLNSSGKFSPESISLIENLRQIRNQASHLPDFFITQTEAERYLELAAQSAAIIEATTD